MEKLELYPLEKVNERISYYTKYLASLKKEQFRTINENLLKFWQNYKSEQYPNEKTNS